MSNGYSIELNLEVQGEDKEINIRFDSTEIALTESVMVCMFNYFRNLPASGFRKLVDVEDDSQIQVTQIAMNRP